MTSSFTPNYCHVLFAIIYSIFLFWLKRNNHVQHETCIIIQKKTNLYLKQLPSNEKKKMKILDDNLIRGWHCSMVLHARHNIIQYCT